ncbi:MAG: helix-turn-helix transcriptional regulator [Gammaproteobacteria bacterium]|nr:helix-turn-helix transcriptional regulator [Gammaproteobacteria bacterium]
MTEEYALDLRAARREAGLTQRDCAYLIDVPATRVSHLEGGEKLPTVTELCTLCLVYGRSFESLFCGIIKDAYLALQERLASLPQPNDISANTFNRQITLNALAARLADDNQHKHGPG